MMRAFSLVLLTVLGLSLASSPLRAQEARAVRGGWLADVDGTRHVMYLVVRGTALTGVYCTQCDRPGNLVFVQDGALDGAAVRFTLLHQPESAPAYRETVTGTVVGEELHLTIRRQGETTAGTALRLHRGVHVPAPARRRNANVAARPAYVPPGPPEHLTEDGVLGLWLAFTGPQKQYFMFRRVGTQLLGMVCGPCDTPANMAPIEDISIDGTTLRFNIVHEDNGVGFDDYGPFHNMARATIARHEMHILVVPSYDPAATPVEMTMVGPVVDRPTK